MLTLSVAALLQMGITDRNEICRILNICEREECRHKVKHIDRLFNIRNLLCEGLPKEMFVDLEKSFNCPRCGKQIRTAPCVQCRAAGAWPTKLKDTVPNWE